MLSKCLAYVDPGQMHKSLVLAVKEHPKNVELLYSLAKVQLYSGHVADAEVTLKRTVIANLPKYHKSQVEYCTVLFVLGKTEDARKVGLEFLAQARLNIK